MAEQILPSTRVLNDPAEWEHASDTGYVLPSGGVFLEHGPVWFRNYPYEWAPAMLRAAAELTLRLAREAMAAGSTLKDATPYNIMFEGPRPVFLDVLSFEGSGVHEGIWRPYAQFVRTFIYPLLVSKHFGLHLDELLLTHRDGLDPSRMLRMFPVWRLLLPPLLGSVTIPALMSRSDRMNASNRFRIRPARTSGESEFVLRRIFARADRLLSRTTLRSSRNRTWRYAESEHSYSPSGFSEKERFILQVLDRIGSANLLDIGCNTGHFSFIAARLGTRVVAIDREPDAVGTLWSAAQRDGLDILPLAIDFARPPGPCGWANQEYPSFLDRARGRFDCILMLALFHHLLVTERIPLDRIFELVAALTTRWAVIEYVDPADPQFERIARGRGFLHSDLTATSFESAAQRRFRIVESCRITPTRRVYLFSKEHG